MKKFFVIALAAMSMTFVSCKKSVEDQAKAYAVKMMEAEKSGDKDKMNALQQEMEEWGKSLSEEDQKKVKAAMEDVIMEEAAKQLGVSVEELKANGGGLE